MRTRRAASCMAAAISSSIAASSSAVRHRSCRDNRLPRRRPGPRPPREREWYRMTTREGRTQ